MIKKALCNVSVFLFLAAFLFPAGRLQAQSGGQSIVTGSDPQPTGEPKVYGGDALLLGMEFGMLMAV